MPNLRSYYPTGASVTEVGPGSGIDPTQALQALIGQETSARRTVVMPPPRNPMGGVRTVGSGSGIDVNRYGTGGRISNYRMVQPRLSMADMNQMDIVGGDLQKTAMQRMTDRSNMMRTLYGVPSGDTKATGSYNPGPDPTDMFMAMSRQRAIENAGPSAAEKTAMARKAAGWSGY